MSETAVFRGGNDDYVKCPGLLAGITAGGGNGDVDIDELCQAVVGCESIEELGTLAGYDLDQSKREAVAEALLSHHYAKVAPKFEMSRQDGSSCHFTMDKISTLLDVLLDKAGLFRLMVAIDTGPCHSSMCDGSARKFNCDWACKRYLVAYLAKKLEWKQLVEFLEKRVIANIQDNVHDVHVYGPVKAVSCAVNAQGVLFDSIKSTHPWAWAQLQACIQGGHVGNCKCDACSTCKTTEENRRVCALVKNAGPCSSGDVCALPGNDTARQPANVAKSESEFGVSVAGYEVDMGSRFTSAPGSRVGDTESESEPAASVPGSELDDAESESEPAASVPGSELDDAESADVREAEPELGDTPNTVVQSSPKTDKPTESNNDVSVSLATDDSSSDEDPGENLLTDGNSDEDNDNDGDDDNVSVVEETDGE